MKTMRNEQTSNQHKQDAALLCWLFCCFSTLSSSPLVQLSKISNAPSELFQSVPKPSWPRANCKPLLTFKASPLFLCTSGRNAIGNLDQGGWRLIKVSFSEDISIEQHIHFDYRARENLFPIACSEYFSRHTCFTQSEICMVHSQEAHTTSSLIISYIKQANRKLI